MFQDKPLTILEQRMIRPTEYFPIVTEDGSVTGKATRKECHSDSFLLHPVVHLHVFNSAGELYLQKRALDKDIQPGKWDTSVGGHVDYGEEIFQALLREANEELGISGFEPLFAFKYPFRSNKEYELVNTYYTIFDEVITPDPGEITEGRFWKISDIEASLGKNLLTPNFEWEFEKIVRFVKTK